MTVRTRAPGTVELHADMGTPPFFRRDPGPHLPGRIVPDVLGVPTFQGGHPVSLVVLVEGNHAPLHRPSP